MNKDLFTASAYSGSRRLVLEMLGFSDAERAMLASTFRLSGRRSLAYAEAESPGERSDIYLVNSDNPAALAELSARAPNVHAPAVLIGSGATDGGMLNTWPLVDKPIRWSRLFQQLDSVMHAALAARARRQTSRGSDWDGRTYRRSVDRSLSPALLAPAAAHSVLVVDDSATVRAFMRAKLAPFRFEVDYADSGEKAIDMAQARKYTCVFLDIVLPGIDGYQVCKSIKSNRDASDTAIVMLSSRSSTFDRFRGSWAGCDAYLAKPVSEDELLATIARFLPDARRVAQRLLGTPAEWRSSENGGVA